MAINEKVLTKIQNLLETTEANGATAEESQSAVALAQKLMAKHNIEMSDVEVAGKQEDVEPITGAAHESAKLNWWEKVLALSIAKNFRVKTYTQTRGRNLRAVIFLGEPNDVEIAKNVYKFALAQLEHHAKKYRRKRRSEYKKENGSTQGFDGVTLRNDYMNGYIKGLEDKLREQASADEEFALIIQTPESVVKRFNEMSMRSDRVRTRSAGDAEARNSGYKQGQKFASPAGALNG